MLEVIIDHGSAFITYGNYIESKGVQFPGRDGPDKIRGAGRSAVARNALKFVALYHRIRMWSDQHYLEKLVRLKVFKNHDCNPFHSFFFFVFSVLFIPSFNVLSHYFYVSHSLVVDSTVWILINRGYYMAARKYEISLRVLKNISRVSTANEWNIFSTGEEKFRISKRPCNVPFII